MTARVDAVRRKLVGSVHRAAIDHAVDRYGMDRAHLEEVLVLCGGDAAEVRRMWELWNERVSQHATVTEFDLPGFIAFIRRQQLMAQVRPDRRKRRRRGGRR